MRENQQELKAIRGLLEQARDRIERILAPTEALHMRWRCLNCGFIKHFTRPMQVHVAPPCPKCKGTAFEPVSK